MKIAAVICTLLLVLLVAPLHAVDVPTWQVNDWWNLTRTFDVNVVASQSLSVHMLTTETVRLTVADITDRTTTEAGTVRVYRRVRSNGQLAGQGTVNYSGVPINVRWKPDGSTTMGEEWVAVGDLGQVREHVRLEAILQAQALIWWTLATITIDMTTDSGPPNEQYDFPIQTVGEQWRTSGTQHIYGQIRVVFNPAFPLWPGGTPPADIDMPVDQRYPTASLYRYVGEEAHGNFATTHKIMTPTTVTLWYAPAAKDTIEAVLPNIELTSGSFLRDVKSLVTGYSVAADPNLSASVNWPKAVEWGDRFQLVGTTANGTTVTATILGESAPVRTVCNSQTGGFEFWMTAPDHNDHSPADDDQGSFGIELTAQGIGRKVISLQVYRPASESRRWSLYR